MRLMVELEEGGKYARVMRKAKDTYSIGDLDGEINTRRVEGKMPFMGGNVFEIIPPRKEATKYDQEVDIEEERARNGRWVRIKKENKSQRVRRTDRYARVMRSNQNLFSRPIKRFWRPMKKQDEGAFSKGMLTRVG